MVTITIDVSQSDVYEEVKKLTDYTGSKMIHEDDNARDRVYAGGEDLATMSRFWDEAIVATNDALKEMLVSGKNESSGSVVKYALILEVSKAFDTSLTGSIQDAIRSFFVLWITGHWFGITNKDESAARIQQASEMLSGAERMLYTRRRPMRPV